MEWIADALTHAHEVHLMPVDDLRPHHPDRACWCCPLDSDMDGRLVAEVVVHHALDGREKHDFEGEDLH